MYPQNLSATPAERSATRVERILRLLEEVDAEARDAGRRRFAARSIQTVSEPLSIRREVSPIATRDLHPLDTDRRPYAATREPCVRCQTRGDIGCAHQRPFVPVDTIPPGRLVANSGRTAGEVQAPLVAAVEAGRDTRQTAL